MKRRLEQYAYMAAKLDEALARRSPVQSTDAERPRLSEGPLLCAPEATGSADQLAVTVQGYLALDLIRKTTWS